jgi:lipid-A-disaccharide synthase
MVVAYRVSNLSYRIATALASTRTVSMPNHLMSTPLVPEFLQHDANEGNLVPAIERLLDDDVVTQQMRQGLSLIQQDLNFDTNTRIVDAVLQMARRR